MGSFLLQALSRPAHYVVEVVEQFSHPREALENFAIGTLPENLACARLPSQACKGVAVTSHLPKRVRSISVRSRNTRARGSPGPHSGP